MFEKLEKLAESLWKNETLWKYSSSESAGNKCGVCDYEGNIILPMIFDEIEMSLDKQIVGKLNGKFYYFAANFEDDKTKLEITGVFYVDSKGQIVEEEGKNIYIKQISKDIWLLEKEDNKLIVIDKNGNILVE